MEDHSRSRRLCTPCAACCRGPIPQNSRRCARSIIACVVPFVLARGLGALIGQGAHLPGGESRMAPSAPGRMSLSAIDIGI